MIQDKKESSVTVYKLANGFLITPNRMDRAYDYSDCTYLEGFNLEKLVEKIQWYLNTHGPQER